MIKLWVERKYGGRGAVGVLVVGLNAGEDVQTELIQAYISERFPTYKASSLFPMTLQTSMFPAIRLQFFQVISRLSNLGGF